MVFGPYDEVQHAINATPRNMRMMLVVFRPMTAA
jgi:hypothetical protein